MGSLFPELGGEIKFFVPIAPVAQPRQRHMYSERLKRVLNYVPASHPIHLFKQTVRDSAKRVYTGPPLQGPLIARLLFLLPRTTSIPKRIHGRVWAPGRPDIDNYEKAVLDALHPIKPKKKKPGDPWGMYVDDSQVVEVHKRKMYAADTEEFGVHIMIEEVQ